MRTIRIFLASSEELRPERLEFADLILQLNALLKERGFDLELRKWEYADASMGVEHKQKEYNDLLKECEMCVVLYWKLFGIYTEYELTTAYNELCAGRNPAKIYVYFKEGEGACEALETFKKEFESRYGHFYCRFENPDTMRLNFLLQLEGYLNKDSENPWMIIEDSKVKLGGTSLVALDKIPFAALNAEYTSLHAKVESLAKQTTSFGNTGESIPAEEQYRRYDLASEYNKAKEQLAGYEQRLFDLAYSFSRQTAERTTERMWRARQFFEQGHISEANAILDSAEMDQDADRAAALFEQSRIQMESLVREYTLKACLILADPGIPPKERYTQAETCYRKAIALARRVNTDDRNMVELLTSFYHQLLGPYSKIAEGEEVLREIIGYCRTLATTDREYEIREMEIHYMLAAGLVTQLSRREEAKKLLSGCLNYFRQQSLDTARNQRNLLMTLHMLSLQHTMCGEMKPAMAYRKEIVRLHTERNIDLPDSLFRDLLLNTLLLPDRNSSGKLADGLADEAMSRMKDTPALFRKIIAQNTGTANEYLNPLLQAQIDLLEHLHLKENIDKNDLKYLYKVLLALEHVAQTDPDKHLPQLIGEYDRYMCLFMQFDRGTALAIANKALKLVRYRLLRNPDETTLMQINFLVAKVSLLRMKGRLDQAAYFAELTLEIIRKSNDTIDFTFFKRFLSQNPFFDRSIKLLFGLAGVTVTGLVLSICFGPGWLIVLSAVLSLLPTGAVIVFFIFMFRKKAQCREYIRKRKEAAARTGADDDYDESDTTETPYDAETAGKNGTTQSPSL